MHRNDYIFQDAWIGLTKIHRENTWVWTDGTTFDFGNDINASYCIPKGTYPWQADDPDCGEFDNYVEIKLYEGKWNDQLIVDAFGCLR